MGQDVNADLTLDILISAKRLCVAYVDLQGTLRFHVRDLIVGFGLAIDLRYAQEKSTF